jgi:hypothetical protein
MAFNYDHDYYYQLYIDHWNAKCLRFSDAFPGIAYSFGISFETLLESFPFMIWSGDDPESKAHSYKVTDQINYIQQHATRIPNRVLEIGAGRGDVACTFAKMGVDITPIEISTSANVWFERTGKQFFGESFTPPKPQSVHIQDASVDFSKFDTILMIETLEHIKEEEFNKTWNNIVENFHGYFIVTNFLNMAHICIGGPWPNAEEEHCREITPALYDSMSKQAKSVIVRNGSHLVLEF